MPRILRILLIFSFIAAVMSCVVKESAWGESLHQDPGNKAQYVTACGKPSDLAELRRKYSKTFTFRGPEVKQVALTFDDVPDPKFTPQVLDALSKQGVKATFFVVGNRAKKYPELVRRIHREGHMIGNHSYTHPVLKNRSLKQFQSEIQRTETLVQRLAGYRPKMIRPPYGEINEEQVQWAMKNGYQVVNWNVDSLDWKGLDKNKVRDNVINAIVPGSIVLMHAGGGTGSDLSGTVEALPEIIQTLRARGYQFVDLSELLHTTKYKNIR